MYTILCVHSLHLPFRIETVKKKNADKVTTTTLMSNLKLILSNKSVHERLPIFANVHGVHVAKEKNVHAR